MADMETRLSEASKEELVQIITAACGHATTRHHVEGLLDYVDDKKKEHYTAKRRSSRPSTRAVSEASQDSTAPGALKTTTVKRDIKICKRCDMPFEEKENTPSSCCYHPGHWLIEVEDNMGIGFQRESEASEELKNDSNLLRVMSCCCNTKEDEDKGCTRGKHIPMVTEADDGPTSHL